MNRVSTRWPICRILLANWYNSLTRFSPKAGIHAQNHPVYLTNSSIESRHHICMNQKSKVKGDQGRLKMTIIRWQPFQEIDALHRQMDRIFDDMLKVKRQPEMTWKPAVELQNTNDNLILRVQIPGVEAKDLDIQVAREAVAIAGEQRYENKGHIRSEFRYGKFQRVIPLPVAIQNDQVQAEYKNGILTLTLPKVAEARQKVVKINLADNTTEPVATTPTQEPQAA